MGMMGVMCLAELREDDNEDIVAPGGRKGRMSRTSVFAPVTARQVIRAVL
jgi:hypothetical protein